MVAGGSGLTERIVRMAVVEGKMQRSVVRLNRSWSSGFFLFNWRDRLRRNSSNHRDVPGRPFGPSSFGMGSIFSELTAMTLRGPACGGLRFPSHPMNSWDTNVRHPTV